MSAPSPSKLLSRRVVTLGGLLLIGLGLVARRAVAGSWSGDKAAQAGADLVYGRDTSDGELLRQTRSAEDRAADALQKSLAGDKKAASEILRDGRTASEAERYERAKSREDAEAHMEAARKGKEKTTRSEFNDRQGHDGRDHDFDHSHTDGGRDVSDIA
jgi:hypothetical protein